MTATERESLRRQVDAARRAKLHRDRVAAHAFPARQRPPIIDDRPMCEARVGVFAMRSTGSACPYRAQPGERLCGVHLRQGEADLRTRAEREAA